MMSYSITIYWKTLFFFFFLSLAPSRNLLASYEALPAGSEALPASFKSLPPGSEALLVCSKALPAGTEALQAKITNYA